MRFVFLPILGLVLTFGACKGAPETKTDDPASKESVSEEAPMEFAHKATDDDAIGTLPDGIGIAAGTQAPSDLVTDMNGGSVALKDYWSDGPVALIFYRGGWCPYCSFQVHELSDAYSEFQKRGVTPLLISVDRVEEAAKSQATYEIPFPVLSDPKLVIHTAYNVINQVPEMKVKMIKKMGIDLEEFSGETHHKIAVPAVFVIDSKGMIRFAHADLNYKKRPSPEQIFAAIDGLGL